MKKIILTLAIVASFVGCKKSDTAKVNEIITKTDSAFEGLKDATAVVDSVQKVIKDSVPAKIKELEIQKEKVETEFQKGLENIDSLSKSITTTPMKTEEKKRDSLPKKEKKVDVKIVQAPPKVIKETKIIYKNPEKAQKTEQNHITKNGLLEISVSNMEEAKATTKYEIEKYDGIIKSENNQSNAGKELSYLKVEISQDKFDYLVEGLSENVGVVENKNMEIVGSSSSENTMAELEITLYNKNKEIGATSSKSNNFGDRFSQAISGGWHVLEEIFLFLLPFWPLFLAGSFIYYFMKKKNAKNRQQIVQKVYL